MVHFRKKSTATSIESPDKLTKDEIQKYKMRTASVNDPILEAVQEAQPFEQMADTFKQDPSRFSYFQQEDGQMQIPRDIFGNPILQPDMSNPTRNRDERPLDTIRGFEYAITGDPKWLSFCETNNLGFKVRSENWDMLYSPEVNGYNVPFQKDQPVYQPDRSNTDDINHIKGNKKNGFRSWFKK